MIRSALSSTGSRRPGSPASPVLWPTPIPPHPSRQLRLPSPSGTFRRTLVRSLGRRARAGQGQVHGLRRTQLRYLQKEMRRPPRFLGDPIACMPRTWTPAGSARQAIRRAAFAFRLNKDVGTRKVVYFGARSHGLQTRCLRFASRITPATRKTRFRLVASLNRAGLITCGIPRKVSDVFYILPPSPGFSWRTVKQTLRFSNFERWLPMRDAVRNFWRAEKRWFGGLVC